MIAEGLELRPPMRRLPIPSSVGSPGQFPRTEQVLKETEVDAVSSWLSLWHEDKIMPRTTQLKMLLFFLPPLASIRGFLPSFLFSLFLSILTC